MRKPLGREGKANIVSCTRGSWNWVCSDKCLGACPEDSYFCQKHMRAGKKTHKFHTHPLQLSRPQWDDDAKFKHPYPESSSK